MRIVLFLVACLFLFPITTISADGTNRINYGDNYKCPDNGCALYYNGVDDAGTLSITTADAVVKIGAFTSKGVLST